MTVYELNREQLNVVKQDLITNRRLEEGRTPYMSELTDADELISDEEVFESYKDVFFVEEDF